MHMKRKPAPRFWPIHRKEHKWTIKPTPGPHPVSRCIPLTLIIRDMFDLAKNRKEAKSIISQGLIHIDGKPVRDGKFPVGLMDVITIPNIEMAYRVIPSKKGLIPHQIPNEEKDFKLCRIENKTITDGGFTQLRLHDGRTFIIPDTDSLPSGTELSSFDTIKIHFAPSQELVEHFQMTEDAIAMIFGGKNTGMHGKILPIEERPGQKRKNLLVTIEDENENQFQTVLNYLFVIGDTQSHISLPDGR